MPTAPLTEKLVQSAKARPGERLEIWDSKASGLGLRVTDRGVRTWVVRYRTLDGRQPRMTLGRLAELSLAEARDAAIDIRREARNGKDPSAERRAARHQARTEPLKTVGDLADAYFKAVEASVANGADRMAYRATRRGKKPATIKGERLLWTNRLKAMVASERLDTLTRGPIKAALAEIATTAPIQANRARAFLSVMFSYAVQLERLPANPVLGIERPGIEAARLRVLTDQELATIWRGLDDRSGLTVTRPGRAPAPVQMNPATALALKLLLLTLQRRGEVAGMRVDEIDLKTRSWTMGGVRTKNGMPHFVPLSPLACTLIEEALALRPDTGSPFVFPSPWNKVTGSVSPGALTQSTADLFLALGLSDVRVHDFRRTGATLMASERLKVQPVTISRILNHTLDAGGGAAITARHYALYDYAAEKRAALDGWANLLSRIVSEPQKGAPDAGLTD